MYQVDIPKVRGKMAEKRFTLTSLAKTLEIGRGTLSAYLDHPRKIPYRVLEQMAACLCDRDKEACNIFFALELTENESPGGAKDQQTS